MEGLPQGSIWKSLSATDVSEVFTFNWTPEVRQCGPTSVSFLP